MLFVASLLASSLLATSVSRPVPHCVSCPEPVDVSVAAAETNSSPAPLVQTARAADPKIQALIVSGANNHWWQWTTQSVKKMLEGSGKYEVTVTVSPGLDFVKPNYLNNFDVVVLDYNGPAWGEVQQKLFLERVEAGLGVVALHAANNAFPGWTSYEEMLTILWREGAGHGRFHAFDVDIADRDHPITRDLPRLTAHMDELYHKQTRVNLENARTLLHAYSDPESGGTGQMEPMVVTNQYGFGRICVNLLGHVWPKNEAHFASHQDPQFVNLFLRCVEWAANGDIASPERKPNELTEGEQRVGWRSLFNGKDLSQWRGFQQESAPELTDGKGWVVEGGAIRIQAGASVADLVTAKSYQDFEFAFDWRVSEGANSGVMYRVSEAGHSTWLTGPEYQVLDDEKHHDGGSPLTSAGALYGMLPAENKSLVETGEWNSGRVRVIGNRVEHWVNGERVVAYQLGSESFKALVEGSKFKDFEGFGQQAAGHIALQNHGDDVWFRNLRIRDLSEPGVVPKALFNGKGLEGWTHFLSEDVPAEQVWQVMPEGHFVCHGKPSGYLKTEGSYTNYLLRLEWRFDPVTKQPGNSGVLLRMHGEDKIWPRSVEAQLHSGSAGDFWNIGEFPMQADPTRTNGRNTKALGNAEHAVGEWNLYEILCYRGDVVLRVNGEILNQAWDVSEIPGAICLQSEGVPIHFRNISIQEME